MSGEEKTLGKISYRKYYYNGEYRKSIIEGKSFEDDSAEKISELLIKENLLKKK